MLRSSNRLKVVLLVVSIAMLLPLTTFAETKTTDSPQARELAAKEYLKVQPVEQLYQDMINELSAQIPDERRAEFLQTMSTAVDKAKLNQLALSSLVKNFTADELKSMSQFFASSAYTKYPSYLSEVGQGLNDTITLPDNATTPDSKPSDSAPSTEATPPSTK